MPYSAKIIEPDPTVSPTPLDNGTVYVKVQASGDSNVSQVTAEAYTGNPPADPSNGLTQISGTDYYGGNIPAYLGTFRICAEAIFDATDPMSPPPTASDDAGPYDGT